MANDSPRNIDALNQQSRILIQARMLPMDTTLTEDQVSNVRADYIRYSREHDIRDAKAARQIGMSAATISQFRNKCYLGDNDSLARKLNDWMEQDARRRARRLPREYVDTTICQDIAMIVDITCADNMMAAIVAPAGSGKTMMIDMLAERFMGRAIYCHADLHGRSFLKAVAQAVGATCRSGSAAEIMENIVARLRGTNRPLFLDEAHTLRPDVFSRIRTIHDRTGCPIIMVGAKAILTRIDDRRDGAGQLSRRCRQYDALDQVLNVEDPDSGKLGRPLFSREEIRQFLNKLNVKFDQGGFQLAWALSCLVNHGTLGLVRSIVTTLRPDEASRADAITREEIIDLLGLLYGGRGLGVVALADSTAKTVLPPATKAKAG
jgi:DNA transposition AAA+ family ATPase